MWYSVYTRGRGEKFRTVYKRAVRLAKRKVRRLALLSRKGCGCAHSSEERLGLGFRCATQASSCVHMRYLMKFREKLFFRGLWIANTQTMASFSGIFAEIFVRAFWSSQSIATEILKKFQSYHWLCWVSNLPWVYLKFYKEDLYIARSGCIFSIHSNI